LKVEGVANVDIFGGYERELQIIVDKQKLDSYNLSLSQVVASVQKSNRDFALGFIQNSKENYLIGSYGKKHSVKEIKSIHITPTVKLSISQKSILGDIIIVLHILEMGKAV